jgi:hypothetical protein
MFDCMLRLESVQNHYADNSNVVDKSLQVLLQMELCNYSKQELVVQSIDIHNNSVSCYIDEKDSVTTSDCVCVCVCEILFIEYKKRKKYIK